MPPWHTPSNKSELVCFTCQKLWADEDEGKGIYSRKRVKPLSEESTVITNDRIARPF